jgi:K+-transporting ATPase ATPase C chain
MRRQLLTAAAATLVLAVLTGILYPLAVWGAGQGVFNYRATGSFTRNAKGQVIGTALIGQSFLDDKGNALPQYFQPRPSATSPVAYTANASAASNLGPGDPRLVGFIPGLNTVDLDGNTSASNPFANPDDPYCVPNDAKTGNPVISPAPGQQYAKNPDGTYVCNSSTVPERAIAYRQLNGLDRNAIVPVDAVTASFSGLDPDISVANADLQAARVAKARHLPVSTVTTLIASRTNGRLLGVIGEKTINVLDLNLALDSLHP